MDHPSNSELERFLANRLEPPAQKQIARPALEERKLAQSLELLRESPNGYDGLSFRQVQVLHGRPLVEALLQRSFELRYSDSKEMRWLAYNAVKAAESLRPEDHDPCSIADVQAQAWAALANAYKVNSEFAEAQGAMSKAQALLRRGSRDLRLLASLAEVEATLRNSQRRLGEARALLNGAYRIYRNLGDRHLAGRVLISQGMSTEYDGTSRQGVVLFRKGLTLLDPDRDPQLVPAAQQGLITALVGCGEYPQAGELLLRSGLRRLSASMPNVRWVEGRLLAGLGKISKAENALIQVRGELLELGREVSAALAGLDLLPILLQQGKFQKVRETAREIYGTLQGLGIHGEAAKARRYLA
jgi:tetratricopeptide (TPR) repeat protein